MALAAFPTLNASLSEDKRCLLQHPSHNIGVAMDTAKGLLVPCIPAVEEMSVLDIAEVWPSSALLLLLLLLLLLSLLLLVECDLVVSILFLLLLLSPAWDASFW